MNKPLAYVILGAEGSGRREVLVDLISEGIAPETTVHTFLSSTEKPSEFDAKIGTLERWTWSPERKLEASLPDGVQTLFFIIDGRHNPVDQMECLRDWFKANNIELARIFCVVNCKLAEAHPETIEWFDACIHFSDVVLLARRDGVANKWISDFKKRYESLCLPCLFEMVKAGKVKNPAMILDPVARRISLAFDDQSEIDLGEFGDAEFIDSEDEDEEEDDEDGGEPSPDDEEDDEPKEDPYFARRPGGRRIKDIPDITKSLPE